MKLNMAQDTRFIISNSYIYREHKPLFINTCSYRHRSVPYSFRILTVRFIFHFIQSHHTMYILTSWQLFHSHPDTQFLFRILTLIKSFISITSKHRNKSISHPDNAYSRPFHPHIPPLEWYSQKCRILNEP